VSGWYENHGAERQLERYRQAAGMVKKQNVEQVDYLFDTGHKVVSDYLDPSLKENVI
jgi:ribulose bisphosphate carboxylase small subunit